MFAARSKKGSALIEFTLVGLPIMFLLLATFEMARGMWTYHTLAHALRRGLRSAVVHGQSCGANSNNCTWTVADVVQAVRQAGVGLDPQRLNLTLISEAGSIACNPVTACSGNASLWPPANVNAPGRRVTLSATYGFQSAMVLFWPGAPVMSMAGTLNLPAETTQAIQF
jgi:Flp pilus assembly protein TadG